jgi:hypothetical protein
VKRLAVIMLFIVSVVGYTAVIHQDVPDQNGSVGLSFNFYHYSHPDRIFASAKTSGSQPGFRVYVNCNDGTPHDGNWQTQPGPWYGSTASCTGGALVSTYGVRFF